MEYITKVECWNLSIDRSYRPGSDIQLLRFELSGGYLILLYIKKMDNQTYFSIQWKPKERNRVPNNERCKKQVRFRLFLILDGMERRGDPYVNIVST
jgi:hypothetical protein